jgi:signal transduction histidine kinase
VYADINMLNTILRNLISNALKFTPPQGTITLSARQHIHEVEIAVADTGIGIAKADVADLLRLDRKTTSLGTAGEHGTGLGLPLCQDLIEKNNGTLHIESLPKQGTTVRITLPASAPTPGGAASLPHYELPDEQIIELLRTLPENVKADLQNAVGAFNLTQTKALIEAIRQQNQELAEALTQYAKRFQFEELQNLCREIKGSESE